MNLFEIRGLTVSFGGVQVLNIPSLDIVKGERVVITGASGNGKTTLLRSLNRLNECFPESKTGGTVKVILNGTLQDINAVPLEELRRKVGMVFQHPNVLPVSILKNFTVPLMHGMGVKRKDAEQVMAEKLKLVGLWDEVSDRLDKSAASLSGGQQQRLCLARALSLDPEILLLDEPTSSLDPQASELIEEYILKISSTVNIVAVTHSIAQAEKLGTQFIDIKKINKV